MSATSSVQPGNEHTIPAGNTAISVPSVLSTREAEKCINTFEQTCLSKKTNAKFLYMLRSPSNTHLQVGEIDLTDSNFSQAFLKLAPETRSAICFISRLSPGVQHGEKRLAISPESFRWLLEHFQIPHSFVAVLSRQLTPSSWLCSIPETIDYHGSYTCWYTIPVRVAVNCTSSRTPHALSEAGSNQMDPTNYLHLEDTGRDIRPSMLAFYYQWKPGRGGERAICVNFQDGRWPGFVEEPSRRMKEALESVGRSGEGRSITDCQLTVHLVLFSSAAAWWSQALECFNQQLIEYEQQLIKSQRTASDDQAKFYDDMNKALHTMASHLHRYRAELRISGHNLSKLRLVITTFAKGQVSTAGKTAIAGGQGASGTEQENLVLSIAIILTQFEALHILAEELDAKVQAVLALMFQSKQISHMQLLVENGQSLRSIMMSTRDEARSSRRIAAESQAMAQAMRKDSVSMKTLALVSVLFLPGGTFAAILSMPFFDENQWLGEPGKVWLWFVLTVPATLIAVLVYVYFVRRTTELQKQIDIELDRHGMDGGGSGTVL